jgi:STAS domain
VILTIERKKIPPDIEVLEMTGRIILGNSSRDVELKLAEILSVHTKKIIFDLSGVTILDSTGIGILVVCQGKIRNAEALAHRGRLWLRGRDIEDHKRGQTPPVVPFGRRSRCWLLDRVHLILQLELRRFLYGSHAIRLPRLTIAR